MELAKRLRERAASGEPVLGTFMVELRAAGALAILKRGGFDFCMIDTEHGYYSPNEVSGLIAAGKSAGICPIVRVSGPNHDEVTRVLDAGAEGILVPMARSLDYVRAAVAQSKYPPLGQRGVHFLRPHTGFDPPVDSLDYMDRANRELITAVQIETPEAAGIVEDVAAMDGVDMLYVGPGDLSVTMGLGRQPDHPRVLEVAAKIVESCRKHGKIAAGHFGTPALVPKFVEMGMNVLGYRAALQLLLEGVTSYFESVRQELSGAGKTS